jgi:hypothetical protein
MRPGRIIFLSAMTTIVGTLLVQKARVKVPGFTK